MRKIINTADESSGRKLFDLLADVLAAFVGVIGGVKAEFKKAQKNSANAKEHQTFLDIRARRFGMAEKKDYLEVGTRVLSKKGLRTEELDKVLIGLQADLFLKINDEFIKELKRLGLEAAEIESFENPVEALVAILDKLQTADKTTINKFKRYFEKLSSSHLLDKFIGEKGPLLSGQIIEGEAKAIWTREKRPAHVKKIGTQLTQEQYSNDDGKNQNKPFLDILEETERRLQKLYLAWFEEYKNKKVVRRRLNLETPHESAATGEFHSARLPLSASEAPPRSGGASSRPTDNFTSTITTLSTGLGNFADTIANTLERVTQIQNVLPPAPFVPDHNASFAKIISMLTTIMAQTKTPNVHFPPLKLGSYRELVKESFPDLVSGIESGMPGR